MGLNSVCEEKMGGSSSSTASELIVAAGHTNGILHEESTDSELLESESGVCDSINTIATEVFDKICAKVPTAAQSVCSSLASTAESTLNSKCEEKMGGSSSSSTTELIETESGMCDSINSIATEVFDKLCSALDAKVSGAGTICTQVVEAAETKLNSVCEEKLGGSSSSTASELIVAA